MADLTPEQSEALDYLVDMARGHDYAEIAKISEAEDVLLDALTRATDMLAAERECIAQAIEADVARMHRAGGGIFTADFKNGTAHAARIAREVPNG